MGAADRPRRDPAQRRARPPVQPPPPSKPTGAWTASKILTKSSAAVKGDIRAFLLTCVTGWDSYTAEEQRSIIETLPPARRFFIDNPATGKLACPLEPDFIVNDLHLKRAIARFTDDVSSGHYTTSWQLKARQSMNERVEGRFDEYMKQHTDDRFGGDENSSARTSQEPGSHDEQGYPEQGEDTYESTDGEFDVAPAVTRKAGSKSRRNRQGQGTKRQATSRDSSPDPLQTDALVPAAKPSGTATPMDYAGDQEQE